MEGEEIEKGDEEGEEVVREWERGKRGRGCRSLVSLMQATGLAATFFGLIRVELQVVDEKNVVPWNKFSSVGPGDFGRHFPFV